MQAASATTACVARPRSRRPIGITGCFPDRECSADRREPIPHRFPFPQRTPAGRHGPADMTKGEPMKRWLALPFGLLVAAGAGATRVDYLFADGFANAVEFPVVPLTGQVGLPTGSTIDPATLRVGNGIAETAVDATGAF